MVTNGLHSPRYTPLETLLLFQALGDQDLTAIDFDGISGTLVTLPLVKNDAAFDAARLGADSLQRLYLKLLKEEARERQNAALQENGDTSPGTRKRKAASPSLPTVEAAAKHAHLLPGLICRLYSRYRDAELEAIRQEEEIIQQLDKEISDIEAGKWDDQLQAQNGIHDNVPATNAATEGPDEDGIATVTVPEVKVAESKSAEEDAATEAKDYAATPATTRADAAPSRSQELAQPQTQKPAQPLPVHAGKQSSPYISVPQAPPSASQSPVAQSLKSPQRVVPLAPAIKGQPIAPNGYQCPPGQQPIVPAQYGSPSQRPIQMAGQPAGRGYPIAPHPQYPGYPQYPQYHQPPYAQQQAPQHPQQQFQLRPSQQGGFQLPPFQVSAQDPSKAHPPPAQSQAQHSRNSTPQGTPKPAQSPFPNVAPAPYTPQPSHRVALANDRLTESVVASLRKRRSGTTWKASPAPSAPRSPKQPAAEPISPVRAPAQLKQERQKTPAAAQRDADRSRRETTDTKRAARTTRGSSVASSTNTMSLRGRTRSRSIISPAPPDQPSTRRGVKPEPTTPAELDTDTPQPRHARTRRSTLPRSLPRPAAPAPERADMVHATRNFPRLSAVIMNEISAHRHAGPFQKPVSDRDVEGYHAIIRRPQDIKSIKASISAGAKAVAAALAAADDEALVLPRTEELVPPRGVINPAQLEKEVMRMFANAVLFNPGDEGLVRDAREMADDVARKIQDWRGVEREGGEEEESGSSKRRKI